MQQLCHAVKLCLQVAIAQLRNTMSSQYILEKESRCNQVISKYSNQHHTFSTILIVLSACELILRVTNRST
jgi:dimeric dUTPase (all-alpha-NTP-PPase superfamily)